MKRFVTVFVAAMIVASCSPNPAQEVSAAGEPRENVVFVGEYELVDLYGMPCIAWRSSTSSTAVGGLACDWSKYQGDE